MLIYQKYFFKEFFKTFTLILGCFYALYILIDYSSHAALFHTQKDGVFGIATYYASEFVQRLEVLIPFAATAAAIRTLTTLNQHHELAALLAAGIPLKKILKPFIGLAILFGVLLTINSEWVLPAARKQLRHFVERRKQEKHQKSGISSVQLLPLIDAAPLIYQGYDTEAQSLRDVYWVKSMDEVVHMQQLLALETPPKGIHVDTLLRNSHGELIPVAYEKEMVFHEMKISEQSVFEMTTLPVELSLTKLFKHLTLNTELLNEKEAQIHTSFYYKLALPWLTLMILLGCLPFCVKFSRQQNFFLIYSVSLFSLIAFYLMMGAALILGERQVVSPAVAIWSPFTLGFLIASLNYYRLK